MELEGKPSFSLGSRVFVEDRLSFSTVGAVRTERGWVCIDTPADPIHAEQWRQALQAIAPLPIIAVIYTDAGRDRILGSAILLEGKPGLIVAHHQTFDRIRSHGEMGRQQVVDVFIDLGQSDAAERLARTPVLLPNLTFSDRLILRFGSPTLILEHVDGASPGQIWVHIPEHHVVFVGDTVTLNMHPNLGEAELEQWLEQLERLQAGRVARYVVPGRGPLVEPQGIAPFTDSLKTLLRRVKDLAKSRRRDELPALISEFLESFPVPEYERERIQRRVRISIERLFEAYVEEKEKKRAKSKKSTTTTKTKSRKKSKA